MHDPASTDTIRLKLILAYKGTRFKGWQIQGTPQGKPIRTVQGCLEQALETILGRPLRVQGAGRTDSGVHALGQVCHVDIPAASRNIHWQKALNGLLPGDMAVTGVQPVSRDFHARFSSTGKIYTYHLWLTRDFVLPQRSHYVWATGPLDHEAMEEAAAYLTGEHDFKAFQNVGTDVASTIRIVRSIDRSPSTDAPFPEECWTFCANGFLKQMVRNLMGCLVAVGRHDMDLSQVEALLQGRDRTKGPATAPARGLSLLSVLY